MTDQDKGEFRYVTSGAAFTTAEAAINAWNTRADVAPVSGGEEQAALDAFNAWEDEDCCRDISDAEDTLSLHGDTIRKALQVRACNLPSREVEKPEYIVTEHYGSYLPNGKTSGEYWRVGGTIFHYEPSKAEVLAAYEESQKSKT